MEPWESPQTTLCELWDPKPQAALLPYLALYFHPRSLVSDLLQSEGTHQEWEVNPSFLLHNRTQQRRTHSNAALTDYFRGVHNNPPLHPCPSQTRGSQLTSWGTPTSTSEISSSGCFIRSIKILLWSKVFGTRKTIPSSGGSTALMSRGGSASEAVREKQQNIHLMEHLVVLSSCFKEA